MFCEHRLPVFYLQKGQQHIRMSGALTNTHNFVIRLADCITIFANITAHNTTNMFEKSHIENDGAVFVRIFLFVFLLLLFLRRIVQKTRYILHQYGISFGLTKLQCTRLITIFVAMKSTIVVLTW